MPEAEDTREDDRGKLEGVDGTTKSNSSSSNLLVREAERLLMTF